jgi:putative SOS response-associated peptidase YedK
MAAGRQPGLPSMRAAPRRSSPASGPAGLRFGRYKEGEVTADIFGFLTADANAEVGAIHPKAMPVILRTAEEIDLWLTAPTAKLSGFKSRIPMAA